MTILNILSDVQVSDGVGASTSEVYVEQGNFMGRRRRRNAAAATQRRVSAGHEQVLMRHLLALSSDTRNIDKKEPLEQPQENSLNRWSQSVSFLTIIAALLVVAIVTMSVVVWAGRRRQTAHPC